MRDLQQNVTDKIVQAIEAGAGKWQMPWTPSAAGLPYNATTGRRYNGVNVLMLGMSAAADGRTGNGWASYKQWQGAGAQVRNGESGTMIVFAGSFTPKDDDDANRRPVNFLRCSHVFNADQVDGYQAPPAPARPALAERLAHAESFVTATRATIRYGQSRAYYAPELDYIAMPDFEDFRDTDTATATENAYGTLLHELTHWTSHKSRCDRELGKRFGSNAYAAEELIAELGAAFLSAQLSITPEPRADHAAYLASWLKVLKSDKRAIFTAAARASDAVAYLEKLQPAAVAQAA